ARVVAADVVQAASAAVGAPRSAPRGGDVLPPARRRRGAWGERGGRDAGAADDGFAAVDDPGDAFGADPWRRDGRAGGRAAPAGGAAPRGFGACPVGGGACR